LSKNFYTILLFSIALCFSINLQAMDTKILGNYRHFTTSEIMMMAYFKTYNNVINTWNNNGETPLFIAVEEGNLPKVIDLLNKGANPNQRNRNTDTPLINAIRNKEVKITLTLIEAGADPTDYIIDTDQYEKFFPEDMLHSFTSRSPQSETITNDFKIIAPIHSALLYARLEKL